TPPPPTPTLFPYTTLFRSLRAGIEPRARRHRPPLPWPARRHRQVLRPHPLAEPRELRRRPPRVRQRGRLRPRRPGRRGGDRRARSEEHTSELQSLAYLVCR